MDRISVIVPVYNTGKYLVKCISSIRNQTYPNIEIIIVDDGSTDDETITVCNEIKKQCQNVKLLKKANGGSADARNYGICVATGNYLAFVDSDDYIDLNMYSVLMDDIHEYNVKMAVCNYKIEDYKPIHRPATIINRGVYNSATILHYFLLGNWHSSCTVLYHRSLFENYHFPTGETNEDYLLNFHMISSLKRISINPIALYHYVKRNDSNTTINASMKNYAWVEHTEYTKREISKHHPELLEEAEYQNYFSYIVLGNKALLSLRKSKNTSANILYNNVIKEIRKYCLGIVKNRYLGVKYKVAGLAMCIIPNVYKVIVTKA